MRVTKVLIFLTLFVCLGLPTDALTGRPTIGASDHLTLTGSRVKRSKMSSRGSSLPPLTYSAAESASLVASSSSASGNEPLVCWSCSSSSHGNPCYNIDPDNTSAIASIDAKTCPPEETYCTVVHIWYVVETVGDKENVNFSVNRTCASECNPFCMVIGDRTKIHYCKSCCTESYCNTDSSSSSRHIYSISLLASAIIVALAPMLSISIVSTLTNALEDMGVISRPSAVSQNEVFRTPSSASSKTWRADVSRPNPSSSSSNKKDNSFLDLFDPNVTSMPFETPRNAICFFIFWLLNSSSNSVSSEAFDHF